MADEQEKFNTSWISIHRKFIDWEWYQNDTVMRLFLHCLLKANWQDKNWQGQEIKRGQFVTSYRKLSVEIGLTIKQVRTALNKLEATHELTCKTTSQYSIITVNKYNDYQINDTQNDKRMANERQTDGTLNNKKMTNERHTENKQITSEQQTDNKKVTNERHTDEKQNNKKMATTNNKITNNITTTTTTEENFIKKNPDFKFRGEYKNVGLTDRQYNDLSVMIMNKKKLDQYIEELSEKIAEKTDSEKRFDFDYPDMHKVRLKKYWIADKNKNRKPSSSKTSTQKSCREMTEAERLELIAKEEAESNNYEYNA